MRTKLIALALALFCTCGLIAQAADTWYLNKPIRGIVYVGLRNVDQVELDGLFPSIIGKKFTDELYWDVLQKLYALEYFSDISPVALPGDADRDSVILQFTVKERPVVKRIRIVGNDRVRAADILDKVSLKEGDIYNEMKGRLDERAVRDFYIEKGYATATVSVETKQVSDGQLDFIIKVVEGRQTVVSSISFEGNKIIPTKTLRGELQLKEAKLITAGVFQEALLVADKEGIRRYYAERGYIDARVESVRREIDSTTDPEKDLLSITFVVREGEQYTYGGTTFSGNQVFKTEELLAKIKVDEGDILNLNKYDQGYQAIIDLYYENGYTANYISRQEKRDAEKKQVSFTITVVERDRSHIENIIIKGNNKTKDHVITREILFESGDIFSKKKLMDTLRNLYNLRYFSAVAPDIAQGSEENLVDVVFTVEEQSTASIQFGVTFSGVASADEFPLSIFVQWEDKNLFGNGQAVSANLTASPDTQELKLGFSEGWFLGSPLTVSFNLSVSHKRLYTYRDELFPVFSDEDYEDADGAVPPDPFDSWEEYEDADDIDDSYRMEYERWDFSLGASTGYRWQLPFAMTTLRGGLNFSVVQNFYDEDLYRPYDKSIRDYHGGWNFRNSIWTRLSFDNRDINFDPTTGWFASEQVTLYGLFPSIEKEYYVKSEAKLEAYLKLLDVPVTETWNLRVVVAALTTFSMQRPINDSVISETSKLYPDGMFNARGWTSLYNSVRGNVLLSQSLEIRVPVVPGIIGLDFWGDAIAIKENVGDVGSLTLNDFYFSYGPGVRFLIQQFPLRLLFANTFRIQNGEFEWGNGSGPEWKFVLSFNIANL